MTDEYSKTVTVSAQSSWRDDEGRARDECDDRLDRKADDAERREERDGWYLTGSRNGSYSVEHDRSRNVCRYSRERYLTFRQDLHASTAGVPGPISWDVYEHKAASMVDLPTNDVNDDVLERLLELRVRAAVPAFQKQRLLVDWDNQRHGELELRVPVFADVNVPLGRVTIRRLRIIESELTLSGSTELIGLPLEESVTLTPVNNCASEPVQITRTLKYERVKGFSITFAKTITTRTSVGGKLTFAGGEGEASYERTIELQDTREYSLTETESREEDLQFTVSAHKKVTISLITRRFQARRAFQGPIVIDGSAELVYGDRSHRHTLSKLLPVQERTHVVEGYYANLDTRVQPIDLSESPC